MSTETRASPYVALLPFHRREVPVASIRDNGHHAAALLLGVQAPRELYGREDRRAAGVAHVERLLPREPIGHVPAVLGRDPHRLVIGALVVDRGHERAWQMLETFQAVQRVRG